MTTKKLSFALVTSLALLLAGCGAQSTSSSNSSSSSSNSLLAAKSNDRVKNSTDPQQAVSIITAYAGNKYGGDWAKTAKAAEQDGLQVNLYRTNKYQLDDNGQGVAYNVTANGQSTGLVYTLSGNNVSLYQNAQSGSAKKLGTVSRDKMVDYLNDNGQGQLVHNLATGAKVVDKTNGGLTGPTTSPAGSSTKGQTGQYGNEGPVSVPAEMRGTWYTADNDTHGTITFGDHTYKYSGPDDNGDLQTLYKQNPAFLENEDNTTNEAVAKATKGWMRAMFTNVRGMHWLLVHGWTQTAGAGTYFAVHTETINGKQVKVLVEAGGADAHVDAVYYQSQSLADQQADVKYDDLNYMD